jgi:hypothetical protein
MFALAFLHLTLLYKTSNFATNNLSLHLMDVYTLHHTWSTILSILSTNLVRKSLIDEMYLEKLDEFHIF